jgi:predicted nucleic acid-binding protein
VKVRAVLDTQVVVRGLLGIRRSACAHVFEALAEGAFTALASPHILTELRSVLNLPRLRTRYRLTDDQVAEFLDSYGRQAEMVAGAFLLSREFRLTEGIPASVVVPPVPIEDIPIVSAALEGGADHIVTDDGGLLEVKTIIVSGYRPVQVIAPSPFLGQVLGRTRGKNPGDNGEL